MRMKNFKQRHSIYGETLYLQHGKLTVGIPLQFGIRIGFVSFDGSENLLFEQPLTMTDLTTPQGWRIYGGHRLWIAPEGEHDYFPDNQPVRYELTENGVIVSQQPDAWLQMEKRIQLEFISENALKVTHIVRNTAPTTRRCALWSITSMAGGGEEKIPMRFREGGYDPLHRISMWDYTNLGDERVTYTKEMLTLRHKPTGKKYKIGVGHPAGPVTYTNKGVVFEKSFDIKLDADYPDGNVSFETFMGDHMLEVESLSPLQEILPQQEGFHCETWTFYNKEAE